MKVASAVPQIPLPLAPPNRLDFGMYWPGEANRPLVEQLQRLARGAASGNVYLWGEAATGKSHLLQAVCAEAAARGARSALVPLSQYSELKPAMLEGLEGLDLVCVDDLDRIGGDADWERGLFNLFNGMREAGRPLVIAARHGPKGLALDLEDLISRLSWDLVFHVEALNEEARFAVLRLRAGTRGFELPDEVIAYLSRRIPRDMHTLFDWLDRLDDASLAAQKKITVPFLRGLLEEKKGSE